MLHLTGDYYGIEVPKDATDFKLSIKEKFNCTMFDYELNEEYSLPIELVGTNYELIGTVTKETIDFDASCIVDDCPFYAKCWKRYTYKQDFVPDGDFNKFFSCETSHESLVSLIYSKDKYFTNPIEKPNRSDYEDEYDLEGHSHGAEVSFQRDLKQWQHIQDNLIDKLVIVKKVK